MKLSDILFGIGKPIAFYPGIAKKVNSCTAGIFLCQFIYWTGKELGKDQKQDGWIYKTVQEIEEETALVYEEQLTARKKLKALNLLEEDYKRLEHKIYYRINIEKLNEWWEDKTSESDINFMQKEQDTDFSKAAKYTENSPNGESPSREPEKVQLVYTENTFIEKKKEERARAKENFYLKENFRPSSEELSKIKFQYGCSEGALEVALKEFIKFNIDRKRINSNWNKAFENWCANRKSWKETFSVGLQTNDHQKTKEKNSDESKIMKLMKEEFGEEVFRNWLARLRLKNKEGNVWIFETNYSYVKEFIELNYLSKITDIIHAFNPEIEFVKIFCKMDFSVAA